MSQITGERKHMHKVLLCQKTVISRNRFIRSRPGYHITACEGWPKLCIWLSARHYYVLTHHLASKNLSSAKSWYSNIEREALEILHGLERFQHYCFAHEVISSQTINCLVAVMGKDVVMLSKYLQCIILCMHQCRVYILYKPGPKPFIADWLSWHNCEESEDKETWSLNIYCQHNRNSSWSISVYINMRYILSDSRRCTTARAKGIYHKGLAHKKETWHRTYKNIGPSSLSWSW